MADHDSEMTRQQYRDSLVHEQDRAASAEKQDEADAADAQASLSGSRANYAAESAQTAEELKVKRLSRKLNWAILGLSIAIVIVFLILFLTP